MHPDSVPDLGAIQIIYLLTYLTKVNESRNMISQWKQRQIGHALKHDRFLQEILEEWPGNQQQKVDKYSCSMSLLIRITTICFSEEKGYLRQIDVACKKRMSNIKDLLYSS